MPPIEITLVLYVVIFSLNVMIRDDFIVAAAV